MIKEKDGDYLVKLTSHHYMTSPKKENAIVYSGISLDYMEGYIEGLHLFLKIKFEIYYVVDN